ncbi:MAG: helix-turn-helix domain-containing protein [Thermomicrobia bacterium]|nr:helix-turn-helix domain-containing protein [Thermomicrobia bacterium]
MAATNPVSSPSFTAKSLSAPPVIPISERPALSIAEAAQLLGVSDGFLRPYVDSGEIPSIALGSRIRLIRREAIDEWLRRREEYQLGQPA